jgi:cell division protein FtsX
MVPISSLRIANIIISNKSQLNIFKFFGAENFFISLPK